MGKKNTTTGQACPAWCKHRGDAEHVASGVNHWGTGRHLAVTGTYEADFGERGASFPSVSVDLAQEGNDTEGYALLTVRLPHPGLDDVTHAGWCDLTAAEARAVARQLLAAADDLDGGRS